MRITILTLFPEMLKSLREAPIVKHAIAKDILQLEIVDLKNYADGSFRHLDDSPYGGGAGMIMRMEPMMRALKEYRTEQSHLVLPLPIGKVYTQKKAHELLHKEHLILLAGHYEGMDARIYEEADEMISLGDYIVSGGEYGCMIIVDSLVRLMNGVIKKDSTEDESFENNRLEYPQYTKPYEYEGRKVPDVLRSGDHAKIAEYRRKQSFLYTLKNRPDLFEKTPMNDEEKKWLEEDVLD